MLKLARWCWRSRFLKFRQCVFTISLLSFLWKGRGLSFDQNKIPFTQGSYVPSLVDIGPVILEKKMKMWKNYRQTIGRQAIRKGHLSFKLMWTETAKKVVVSWKLVQFHNTITYQIDLFWITYQRFFVCLLGVCRPTREFSLI